MMVQVNLATIECQPSRCHGAEFSAIPLSVPVGTGVPNSAQPSTTPSLQSADPTVRHQSLLYSLAQFSDQFSSCRAQLTASESGNQTLSTQHKLAAAVCCLKRGGVVAVPTDTLYGLAGDTFNAAAIERVFAIKERPEGMALPVLLADADQLPMVAINIPADATVLAAKYWPGPLTLIMEKNPSLPPRLTAGGSTVAVRVPAHSVPRELARLLCRPITGTSANISGSPDPKTIEELRSQVGDRVDCLVDCGPRPAGTASTIVDLSGVTPKLIREGAIPFSDIAALLDNP